MPSSDEEQLVISIELDEKDVRERVCSGAGEVTVRAEGPGWGYPAFRVTLPRALPQPHVPRALEQSFPWKTRGLEAEESPYQDEFMRTGGQGHQEMSPPTACGG